ncbi:hypothetical protein BGLT_06605 [Caballeronia glathei]|nr:hypothetical protein BGLT_06605 [Caballeronia glathei]
MLKRVFTMSTFALLSFAFSACGEKPRKPNCQTAEECLELSSRLNTVCNGWSGAALRGVL